MASPPDAHDNAVHGAVSGQLVQARDIHGGVTINVPSPPPAPVPLSDVSLDLPRLATAVRGRDELLDTLGAAMAVGAPVPHILTGPGGFGKTTVAAALAERARADGWTVFWVRPGNVAASMLEAAVEAGGSRAEAEQVRPTRRQAARWVWRHLDQAPRPWLLVIDNADRPEELDPENRPGDQLGWMRASPGGFVLVTSRVDDPAQWAPAHVHRIGELGREAATTALTDHAGAVDLPGADELADRLGGVPLAVFLAGRILATHQVLFPDARALLARLDQDVSALDALAAPLVTGGDTERRLLSGVWELSLRLVTEHDVNAAPLLRLLSVLGSEGSPVPLRRLPVSDLADNPFDALDEVAMAHALNALVVHGLVTLTTSLEERALRLHPLVSESVRAGMTDDDLPLLDVAERLLSREFGNDPALERAGYTVLHDLNTRLRPHHPQAALDTLVSVAHAQIRLGQRNAARAILRTALEGARDRLGADHPTTFRARHLLAESRLYQGHIDEAERALRALVADKEAALGSDAPSTLDTRYLVTLAVGRREDWNAVVDESRRLLADRVRVSGDEHPQTLFVKEGLAYALFRTGDADTALREMRAVRAARVRTVGEHHERTRQVDLYLAVIARDMGDHAAARRLCERLLDHWLPKLGPEHQDTVFVREILDGLP
ncbi:tetratricopeptide repeat protein [Nocardiopsis sp. NRRL B-16309]|uniref:tetratricopeptide repeat protein n=1 Tax=Nocardiopsis sp. NRRL B-16309 TaxID=1519494 RepID=UPI0006AED144|nr:tetratricopeptide repeat protein [Nocardiopsis sp. NRRL B-16309]KOX22241.1 ATP/GTP-binding protein [Nocardiopsis sp. NRRL B-16309]